MLALMARLRANGYQAHLIEAPLIVATTGSGHNSEATLMPLSSSSSFEATSRVLKRAAQLANAVEPDPDLDLPIGDNGEPRGAKWSSHSFRRMFDTLVRTYVLKHNIPRERLDAMAGWKEAERSRDMQTHYDAEQLWRRMEAAMMTAGA